MIRDGLAQLATRLDRANSECPSLDSICVDEDALDGNLGVPVPHRCRDVSRRRLNFALLFTPLTFARPLETSFLAYLRGRSRKLPQVAVGIGDDAAVLDSVDSQQLACVDQVIDGVDFVSAEHELKDIGYKSMAINLSDIAAMGGTPTSALISICLPSANPTRIAGEVYEGILEAAVEFQIAIAGGDITSYDGPLSIGVTLLGTVPQDAAFLRSGAQEGDAILVSGAVGGSILGRHLRPSPRVALAHRLREQFKVTAAIDVSDGLSLDLDRLCAASGAARNWRPSRFPFTKMPTNCPRLQEEHPSNMHGQTEKTSS
ncbi:MAG: thiamine-phosphate kinase [Rubripirellula sp.]